MCNEVTQHDPSTESSTRYAKPDIDNVSLCVFPLDAQWGRSRAFGSRLMVSRPVLELTAKTEFRVSEARNIGIR